MAGIYNIRIDQGADEDIHISFFSEDKTPISLVSSKVRMQARECIKSPVAVLNLTSENGGILVGDGTVRLIIPSIRTRELKATSYVYDLEIESADGKVTRMMQGNLIVSPEVTR